MLLHTRKKPVSHHFSALRVARWVSMYHDTLLKLSEYVTREITRHNTNIFLIHVGLPLILLICQLQEPANVFGMVAMSVGREEVSKETFHEATDTLVVTVEVRSEAVGGQHLNGHIGYVGQPWTI